MSDKFTPLDWSSLGNGLASIQRAAARVGSALVRGILLGPSEFGKAALELLTIDNLWALSLVMGFWVLGSVVGGPIGLVVNAVLIALAIYELPDIAVQIAKDLKDGVLAAIEAESDQQIEKAAQLFGRAIGTLGIEVFQVLVTHRVFKATKTVLLKRFKIPAALEAEHRNVRREISEKIRVAAELAAAAGVQPAASKLPSIGLPSLGIWAAAIAGLAGSIAVVALVSKSKSQ